MRRVGVVLVAWALAAACGDGGPTLSSSTTAAVPASTTTSVAATTTEPPVVLESCAAPPVEVSLLCEAVSVIERHHVDPFAPDVLAAAGLLGLEAAPASSGGGQETPVACPVPTPEFRDVCTEIGRRVAEGMAVSDAVTAVVQGMFRFGLDPYSEYVPPHVADVVVDPGTGLIPWVGIVVSLEDEGGAACAVAGAGCDIVVESVLAFGSADEEGILPGDRILAMDGDPLDGLDLNEVVVGFVRPPGTGVVLEIGRDGRTVTKTVTVLDIRLDPVEFTAAGSGFFYLRMNDFSQQAASEVGEVLRTIAATSDPVRGLVLDLRGNPGGLVLAAQAVASQFLSEGVVMIEQEGDRERVWPVIEGGLAPEIELVVVVDGGTASAAEVVAAALSDAGRALVVGTPTYGKDIVQDVFDARNGGEFVLSVSRWTSPAGRDVGIIGLEPDVLVTEVPTTEEDPALTEAFRRLGA